MILERLTSNLFFLFARISLATFAIYSPILTLAFTSILFLFGPLNFIFHSFITITFCEVCLSHDSDLFLFSFSNFMKSAAVS